MLCSLLSQTCLSRRDRRKNFPKAEQRCASAVAQQETTGDEKRSLSQSPSAVEMSSPGKGSREDRGVQEGRRAPGGAAASGQQPMV